MHEVRSKEMERVPSLESSAEIVMPSRAVMTETGWTQLQMRLVVGLS